jgi:hypothetical protein
MLLATARLCGLFESFEFNAFGKLESAGDEGVVGHGTFFLSNDLPRGQTVDRLAYQVLTDATSGR